MWRKGSGTDFQQVQDFLLVSFIVFIIARQIGNTGSDFDNRKSPNRECDEA